MNYEKIAIVAIWLIVGYLFTVWFVNHFLEDRRWDDTRQEVGPGMMILLNLVGPIMVGVMLITLILAYLLENTGNLIRRFYCVRD